ncbi:amino acid adenylation protein [Nocardiopsis dassonvillei]|nr:amino acid adenylation protein [Nocardiopsis dassonvillei]
MMATNSAVSGLEGKTFLAGLLERQAGNQPDATGLVYAGRAHTYADLNARANRLARALIDAGVGPETRVAVSMRRCPGAIVALFAVLKAGGVYLPIDATHPRERIGYVLADSAPKVAVTDDRGADALGRHGVPMTFLRLGEDGDTGGHPADHDVRDEERRSPLRPDNLAYVMYTSGSTGRPKGVQISQSSLGLYSRHYGRFFDEVDAGRRLRIAHTAALTFDVGWNSVIGLAAGHEMHLYAEEDYRDVDRFVRIMSRHRLDCVVFTASYWGALVQSAEWGRGEHTPRVLLSCGEAFPNALWQRLRGIEGTRVMNTYGPTEATVEAVATDTDATPRPTLGTPIPDTGIHVLDDALAPAPTGSPGELYITGARLARGYLNRPGLTAERFVASPFAPGERMYRTGDVVRRNDVGDLEFLGRVDDQVKIRGFRVEPGEVEAVLASHPAVSRAAVVVREDRDGARGLVGYFVVDGGGVDEAELRRHLGRALPDYMVPSALLRVDEMPLNANGKLDRGALPEPTRNAESAPDRADTVEEVLLHILREVLEEPGLGPGDLFTERGGDSIRAFRVVTRARDSGVVVSTTDVLRHQSATAIAGAATVDAGAGSDGAGPTTRVPDREVSELQKELGL